MSDPRSLKALISEIESFADGLPPVHTWAPERVGDIDILIDAAGEWFHEGKRIEREALVRVFASILRRDVSGEYALVTPVERLRIQVEDVPFAVVDVESSGDQNGEPIWVATTSLGERVTVDTQHPLRAGQPDQGESGAAYLVIRPAKGEPPLGTALEGRLTRSAWYRLAEGLDLSGDFAVLRSGGVEHTLSSL